MTEAMQMEDAKWTWCVEMPLQEAHVEFARAFGDAEVENVLQGLASDDTYEEVEASLRDLYPDMIRVRWIVPIGREPEESRD